MPPLRSLSLLVALLAVACGSGDDSGQGEGHGSWGGKKREARPFPVATEAPQLADVDDRVETQATLESDRRTDILAEIDGRVIKRLLDVGGSVGEPGKPSPGTLTDGDSNRNGNGGVAGLPRERHPLDLAYIDGRDRALDLRETEIQLQEALGRKRELTVERDHAERLLTEAQVGVAEANASFERTGEGITDGTISREEHISATFGKKKAKAKLEVANAALAKTVLALELVAIEESKAELARDRALLANEKTTVRAPFPGVVTVCNVRAGQRVRAGDLLYRVEDTSTLVVYGDLPVRQAARVRAGNSVTLGASAVANATTGTVVMVAPTVESESGTVRVKVEVQSAPGFKPGLFVTLRIVVDTRKNAPTVPKRAVLHDDEDGAYVYLVKDGIALRTLVTSGYSRGDRIEILEGLDGGSAGSASSETPDGAGADGAVRVVVEGQDTLTDGAKVEDLALKKAAPPETTDADGSGKNRPEKNKTAGAQNDDRPRAPQSDE